MFIWFKLTLPLRLDVRAIFTPFPTRLPAALTMLTALAFDSADPESEMVLSLVEFTDELPTAMSSALADCKEAGPFTSVTTCRSRLDCCWVLSE